MASSVRQYGKRALLYMPVEIIAIILLEWTMMEWFAPVIARQICHYLKQITDSSPRLWSKLSLTYRLPVTPYGVRTWLNRSRSAPKEILIETNDLSIIRAALEGAKDARSLLYRVPNFHEEVIRLPVQMLQLRHLHIDTPRNYHFVSMNDVFGLSNPCLATFPCLTVLNMFFVDMTNFRITPGLFPAIRRLVLHFALGPILDLVRVCSRTLEHLRVTMNDTYGTLKYPHDPIRLPNLKVLFVDNTRKITCNIEAPALRLIYADFVDIEDHTRPFNSLVEWVTRSGGRPLQRIGIAGFLKDMPNLQRLMISQHIWTLTVCFEALRDDPSICPYLQFIEVVEFVEFTKLVLGPASKEFLTSCVAQRAEKLPGFTLRFVSNVVQRTRVDEYYRVSLSFLCVITYSHHIF